MNVAAKTWTRKGMHIRLRMVRMIPLRVVETIAIAREIRLPMLVK
jgi:hypothetical protein